MDAVLLDTDVFSYLLKGDSRAPRYQTLVAGKTVALSFVTVGELLSWAIRRNWGGKRRADLLQRLRSVLVIPYDLPLCQLYANLCSIRDPDGNAVTVPSNDRWIAASALRHGLPFVTGNVRHFRLVPGLVLLEPPPQAPETVRLPM
jgi:predicted nucleic acid-binding protein